MCSCSLRASRSATRLVANASRSGPRMKAGAPCNAHTRTRSSSARSIRSSAANPISGGSGAGGASAIGVASSGGERCHDGHLCEVLVP
eukprot:8403577-Alexandrium_andersonii.AAC.1